MRNTLFVRKDFVMHSGGTAHYKIECDALTDDDLETLAFIVAQKTQQYTQHEGSGIQRVYGVPRGGTRFAHALEKHVDRRGSVRLIVDDVLTTGRSMEEARKELNWEDAIGVVIFARGTCPNWIKPIFDMHWFNTRDEF